MLARIRPYSLSLSKSCSAENERLPPAENVISPIAHTSRGGAFRPDLAPRRPVFEQLAQLQDLFLDRGGGPAQAGRQRLVRHLLPRQPDQLPVRLSLWLGERLAGSSSSAW